MLDIQNADIYTDFSGLAKLKQQAKTESSEAINEVAKQFESIFLNRVLKSMRQAKLAEGIFDSDQSQFYQDMYDQQLSIHLSGDGGMGLASLIAQQLSPEQENQKDELSIDDYLNRSVNASKPVKTTSNLVQQTIPTELEVNLPTAHAVEAKHIPVEKHLDKPINSSSQFVSQLRPYAEKAAAELGVDANVLLAQSALETGWGKSVIKDKQGESSHNLFNIKANKSWKGKQTTVSTLEYDGGVVKKELAGFRSYPSYTESFKDYVNFIKSNPRYSKALAVVSKPEQYMQALQQAGYATDPNYASKVMKIYHSKALSPVEGASSLMAMK